MFPNLTMLNASATVKIGSFSHEDLEAVLEVQKLATLAPAWRLRDYAQLVSDPRGMILVAKLDACGSPGVLGFSVTYRVDEEAELWNIAVAPQFRRQGIARSLLREVCRKLVRVGVQRLFLEVRASNSAALGLYYSLGFTPLLTRKRYYQNPAEDALVLVCKLSPSEV